jgi:hypothetical protein
VLPRRRPVVAAEEHDRFVHDAVGLERAKHVAWPPAALRIIPTEDDREIAAWIPKEPQSMTANESQW